jgi:hypothetical protein
MYHEHLSGKRRISPRPMGLFSPRTKRSLAIMVRIVVLIALPTILVAVTILVASWLSH